MKDLVCGSLAFPVKLLLPLPWSSELSTLYVNSPVSKYTELNPGFLYGHLEVPQPFCGLNSI